MVIFLGYASIFIAILISIIYFAADYVDKLDGNIEKIHLRYKIFLLVSILIFVVYNVFVFTGEWIEEDYYNFNYENGEYSLNTNKVDEVIVIESTTKSGYEITQKKFKFGIIGTIVDRETTVRIYVPKLIDNSKEVKEE